MLNFFFMEKYRFQIGDRVRVIGNSNNHGFSTGDTVRIKNVSLTEAYDYIAEYLDRHDYWYVRARDLEPFFPPKTKTKEMATAKKAAQKTASKKSATKKAAPKKAAAKKAASKKAVTKTARITPLSVYDNYSVGVNPDNHDIVSFGCGAVQIPKAELLKMANLVDSVGDFSAVRAIVHLDTTELMELNPRIISRAAEFLSNPDIKALYKQAKVLADRSRGRKSVEHILQIDSGTFRRLAAVTKVSECS